MPALIRPDFVNRTFFPVGVEKYACMTAVNIQFLKGQSVVDPISEAPDKINAVDVEKPADTPDIMLSDPDVAGSSSAAESPAGGAGFGVKTIIKSGLLQNRHSLCSSSLQGA